MPTPFRRRIASLVLVTFTSLTLQPLQAVAGPTAVQSNGVSWNGVGTTATTAPAASGGSLARYADLLETIKTLAQQGAAKMALGQSSRDEAQAIRSYRAQLDRLEAGIEQEFAATEQQLDGKHLPAAILARHRTAVADFRARQTQLKASLDELDRADAANDDARRGIKVRDLDNLLRGLQKTDPHRDAGHLPFRTPAGDLRTPIETQPGYNAKLSLFGHKPVHLAGAIPAGGIQFAPSPDLQTPPGAAELAATEDIQLTPAIRAQAAALNNNPVQIHNWVRNTIEFVPGYGSIQGADMTLQTQRGNAFDTASLEIALLRAANIPARYVYGTIQIPVERAMNWLGGLTTPEAALNLLGEAGIPAVGVITGGAISHLKLEHIWVEAWVDYVPSRGAVNRVGDTWIPLDPSFKLAGDKPGLNLQDAVSLNAQGVLDAAKQGATCSADNAQGLSSANLQSAYSGYQDRLATYLGQQGADLTVGDVLGTHTLIAKNYPILLGTLPYQTVAVGARFASLPDTLRWRLRYALYAGAAERAQNLSSVAFSAGLPSLVGKRLTLSFAPATPADADTLAAYLPQAHADGSPIQPSEFPADLPAYLIHVKAELRVDGQVVASGGDFALGTPLTAGAGFFVPANGAWDDGDHDVAAGEYHAFALDGQGIAPAQLDALNGTLANAKSALAAKRYAALDRDGVAGLLLQQVAVGYFALADANTRIYQRASAVVDVRLPSLARAIARVEPRIALGIVAKVSFPGMVLSVDRYQHAAVSKTNAPLAAYNRQSMERASAYTHLVLEHLLTDADHPGQGVSAVKALAAANALQQAIRLIDAGNAAAVVPQLAIDAAGKSEILNAANAGKRILAQDGTIAADRWVGSGYIVEDPQQGMGDYRLSGDANGVLYPVGGMGWLALGSPAQSAAALGYALANGSIFDSLAGAVLGGMDSTRWQYFPAQAEIMNGLFLSNLNALQPAGACDALAAVIASALGASSGISTTGHGINHAPVIQSTPLTQAAAGQAYRYALQALDPDGDPLSYRLVTGPGGMSIDVAGLVTWAAPIEGGYSVTLRVDDGQAYTEQSYLLAVGKGGLQLALSLSVSPKVANPGERVTVTVVTSGGSGTPTRSLSVDGQVLALDANGQASLTAAASGVHRLVATAADGQTTLTREDIYSVRDPSDTTAPAAQITAPVDDAELTAPTDITGTAQDSHLAYYQLLLRPAGAPDSAWVEIGRGYQSVTNGKLGQLDTSVLANGLYDLGLNAVDTNGQQTSTGISIELTRDLKIGQFSISFRDLEVNAAGIPLRVTRTYDTRNKGQALDFGYGWSIDYQSIQIKKNMALGLQWDIVQQQLSLCLRPAGQRKIAITLPDGSVQRYTAANAQECAFGQIPPVDIRFTPAAGTTATLEAINLPNLIAQGGQLYDMDHFGPWNPSDFKLTTEDGYIYYLKEGTGITQVKDPYGNTLTYGQNGILHSNGQSVAFSRDAQGRITAITDPSGKVIHYRYDANGNLVQTTNRLSQTSQYDYNRDHGLSAYTDPAGSVLARYSYDGDGRLISVTDAAGKAIQASHDLANNREIVTDRLGRTTAYTYDSQGNVTEIVDPMGNKTAYQYDALGNETRITDPLGHSISKTYDPSTGKQLSETDPLGHTKSYAYDNIQKTQRRQSTDKNGNVTTYGWHNGMPVAVTNALGNTDSAGLDSHGNLTSFTLAGKTTVIVYDSNGNPTKTTDASGAVTTYTYDYAGNETSRTATRTDESGQKQTITTSKTYDAEGRVISETDATGGVTRTTWNNAGKPTQITDPAGRKTQYAYDAQARLIQTTYADGSSETTDYDAEGNKIATTDRAGRTTRYTYDAKNRLVQTARPDGSSETVVYDAAGRTVANLDAKGNQTRQTYDAAGRLISSSDVLNHSTSYQYDANGNRTQSTDANGKTTSYTYDALNRLTRTTYPDGTTRTVSYRPDGRKDSETDPNGNIVQYGYDAVGRISQVSLNANGTTAITAYAYDEQGNKTSQTDAEGKTTRWAYDNGGRVTKRTLPNGEAESYEYDLAGNRIAHTAFNNQKTRYAYDLDGKRLSATDQNGGSTATTYTRTGQVASQTDTRGTTRYQYDALDRLTRQDNPDGSYLAYGYDRNGNVTERSTPSGTTRYGYDGLNRMTAVTGSDGKTTSYQYDANGNRVKTVNPNGTETGYSFDANDRITGIEHRQSASGTVIRGYAYTLKPNGQRAQVSEYDASGTLRTLDYCYDSIGRMVQEKLTDARVPANSRTTDYAYGTTGNRQTKTETQGTVTATTAYSYDADDRLTKEVRAQGTSTTTTSYDWNANGNLTRKGEAGHVTLFGWGTDNRLVEVKRGATEASATTVATYQYDANGNRVGKTTADGKKVVYLVDSNLSFAQVVEEKATLGTNTETTVYLYGLERILQTRGGQGSYYLPDGLGNARLLTDQSGNVTDSYDYEAYGTIQNQMGATKNAYLFAGEQFDSEAGLYYNRARYLDTNTGRFVSIDPAFGDESKPATLNKYIYAGDDPANATDPSGLMSMAMAIGIVTITIAVASIWSGTNSAQMAKAGRGNRQPRLDDIIVTAGIANTVGKIVAEGKPTNDRSPSDGHHPIPKYLCGAENQPRLVQIPRPEHTLIHRALRAQELKLSEQGEEAAGGLPERIFLTWRKVDRAGIRKLAETMIGRATIADGIQRVYGPFWNVGEEPDVKLGPRFMEERNLFVADPPKMNSNCPDTGDD